MEKIGKQVVINAQNWGVYLYKVMKNEKVS